MVGGASDIRVVLKDRREYVAEVLLGDQASDLAILRLKDAEGLPFLPLRDSNSVEVGELTLAIGNPFGVGQTVSSGIISGLARWGAVTGNERGYFIQTDAPINPGNSGGALIDMAGRLIGINTSILTRSGGSNGIGFAIPADLVAAFVARARGLVELFELSPMSDAEILAWFEKDREVLTEKLQGKMRNTVVLRALSRFTDSRDVENVFDAMVAISVCDQEYVRSESDLIKSAAAIYGYERPPIKVDR